MGPDDCSVTVATVDERVGGAHHLEMLAADGSRFTFESVIEELVPDERIVLAFRFHPEAEETTLRLTFRDAADGGTDLRLEHEGIPSTPPLDDRSVDAGWGQALGKLRALFDTRSPTST